MGWTWERGRMAGGNKERFLLKKREGGSPEKEVLKVFQRGRSGVTHVLSCYEGRSRKKRTDEKKKAQH